MKRKNCVSQVEAIIYKMLPKFDKPAFFKKPWIKEIKDKQFNLENSYM